MTGPIVGLVVGKFLPPHAGHHHLVDTARGGADHVLVVVCAREDDPVPAQQRAAALREIHPDVAVVVTNDDVPDHDPVARAEQISQAWAARCTVLCEQTLRRRVDVVFSSEEYGPRFAGYLGARHEAVDDDRTLYPVSGTAVRTDPLRQWEFLRPAVRLWYLPRIVVLGAESTGSTTLARALADHYDCPWVLEYGRTFCEEAAAAGHEISWTSEHFTHIASRQLKDEDDAARHAVETGARLLVCDTDTLATSVWHERYLDVPSPAVQAMAAGRRYTLYILTGDEIPFVQDGTRDGEHLREWMTGRFRDVLATRPEPWIEVTGSREQRLHSAVRTIDALLPSLTRAREGAHS